MVLLQHSKCLCRCRSLSSSKFSSPHTRSGLQQSIFAMLHSYCKKKKKPTNSHTEPPCPCLFCFLTEGSALECARVMARGGSFQREPLCRGYVCWQIWRIQSVQPCFGKGFRAPQGQLLACKLTLKAFWSGHCFTVGTAPQLHKDRGGVLCGTAVLIMLTIEEMVNSCIFV